MVRILLVCSAGISTGVMVGKMKTEAVMHGLDAEIWSCSAAEAKANVEKADVVLLSPEVTPEDLHLGETAGTTPIASIDPEVYAKMGGEAVLEQALELADCK